ncbi:MAG TPA: histidine phosphatase family protein [Anaerolineaceae bacterium]|nr:histidine phosphatase family protein [Anaerolineaceae bacterium]
MTTFLLIRHGDNDTMGKYLAGQMPDIHLNERGRRQAQTLVCQLAAAPIQAVYSSPLERTYETARPLADFLKLEVQIKPGLIELNYGEWAGKSFGLLRRYKTWKLIYEKPEEVRFPGGETFIEVQQRVCAELESIAAAHEKQLVAVFTHADVIRLAITHYLDMPLIGFHKLMIEPASISILTLSDGKSWVSKLNQTSAFVWPEPQKPKRRRTKPEEKENLKAI